MAQHKYKTNPLVMGIMKRKMGPIVIIKKGEEDYFNSNYEEIDRDQGNSKEIKIRTLDLSASEVGDVIPGRPVKLCLMARVKSLHDNGKVTIEILGVMPMEKEMQDKNRESEKREVIIAHGASPAP